MYNDREISKGVSPERVEEFKKKTANSKNGFNFKAIIWAVYLVTAVFLLITGAIFMALNGMMDKNFASGCFGSGIFSSDDDKDNQGGNQNGNNGGNDDVSAMSDDEIENMVKESVIKGKWTVSDTAAPASDFSYEESDNYITITKYNGTAEVVEIPALINGKPVIDIYNDAFANNVYLKEVVMPDTVVYIRWYVFAGCEKLEKVTCSKNLILIARGAFEGCKSLKTFECGSENTGLRNVEWYAFKNCTSLESFVMNGKCNFGEVGIGKEAFAECGKLTNVKLAENVTYLEEFAFVRCEGLTGIDLPKSLVTIKYEAFSYCKNLKNIDISNVTTFENGAFLNCESLEEITISPDVITLGRNVFKDCTSLEKITLSEKKLGAEENGLAIQRYCFENTAITEIIIPGNYCSLEEGAFYNCPNLEKIVWLNSGKNTKNQYMDNKVFSESKKLKDIYLPLTLESMGWMEMDKINENLVIHTVEGSTGWKFAEENSLKTEIWDEKTY